MLAIIKYDESKMQCCKEQYCISSVQSLSRVQLFATPWIAAPQASLSITNSWSSLKLMSIESVMPSSHLILCHPLLLLPPIPPSISLFQWVNSSHEVAQVLEFQLQHHSLQRNPSADLLQNGLVGSPCSPRDSQESSPTPKYKSINCLGTWNIRSMNQSKLDVVKQEMVRINIDILGISDRKWMGMVNLIQMTFMSTTLGNHHIEEME